MGLWYNGVPHSQNNCYVSKILQSSICLWKDTYRFPCRPTAQHSTVCPCMSFKLAGGHFGFLKLRASVLLSVFYILSHSPTPYKYYSSCLFSESRSCFHVLFNQCFSALSLSDMYSIPIVIWFVEQKWQISLKSSQIDDPLICIAHASRASA